jgi:membrane-associated protease RseP (regulator of RpoE activity)
MTTVLLFTLGVLIFAFAILASIGLHELGHMIPCKAFGGKVTQYFIGFGPTVWSKRVGETEYGIKAIPLGGYVKIIGMLPPGAVELADEVEFDEQGDPIIKVRKSNTGLFTQLISDARAAEWELIKPEDSPRLFYKLPWWKKVVVMAGGPSVNIAIAFFIFAGVFATYGNRADPQAIPVVKEVSACVVPYAERDRDCRPGDPIAPAKKAGLQIGDRFVAFNGQTISSWDEMSEAIRANGGKPATIGVLRDGTRLDLPVTTRVELRPTSNTDETLTAVGFLGVLPDGYLQTGGPLYTVEQMGVMTADVVKALGTMPVKVGHVALALIGQEQRDPNGPVSIVGGGRIAGEVASAKGFPLTDKLVDLLMLVAGFNFFIGMFNFVPLLPLDGGHIAGALWEGIRRGVARLRRRPDPGYVDVAKLLPIAYVMASAFLVMGVVLILADIFVPVHVA